ncbi:MAG: TonB-dependent receptor [Glaciecola sp.]|jgi:outer membrane receptor protein involved in Fe transport
MHKSTQPLFKASLLAVAVSASLLPAQAVVAQEAKAQLETIEVTGTRRTGTVQEAPLNITALTADTLAEQNIGQLEDVARWVPGLTVVDQGGRSASPIIVRGLNTNSTGPGSNGGTVATYFGELPLFLNMRLTDIERVEVLIGPQGTLYGAGTLGGAIRYIPKQVELDITEGEISGDIFSLNESDGTGTELGFVFNTPLVNDELAVRASLNYYNDPGFIDYNYVVREGGVSLPDTFDSANLRQVKDANGEKTLTGRIAVRWTPTDDIDATLSYFYQKQDVEGRSIDHFNALPASNALSSELTSKYTSGYRYTEPREKTDDLLSLEVKADLGFAELVSATGFSSFEADGQRDQTDLLIRLNYSYEDFPAFSSFTRELDNNDTFTQELRLVSQGDSALSWIAGVFYNKSESDGSSSEFTPGYDAFLGGSRPDALEYLSVSDSTVTESAFFGELTYAINDAWDVTVGLRQYKYDIETRSAIDLPLYYTVFEGRGADSIVLDYGTEKADDSGSLFKFNTSYDVSDDMMLYFTVSEGFRIGGANGVAACPENVADLTQQIVCALPNEQVYVADTTTNYELGMKSSLLDNSLYFNVSLFDIKWDDAQVAGATVNGAQPITANAKGAGSTGVEISARALLSDELTAYASYSNVNAKLTDDAPFLFGVLDEQGTALQDYYDGKKDDRLSGAPETQASLGLKYTTEMASGAVLDVVYGMTYQSDVFSKVGLRADGEVIPGFALSNVSASYSRDNWTVTAYVDNLFDKYAHTAIRRDRSDLGLAVFTDQNQNRVDLLRNYGRFVVAPRKVGVRFTYAFDM